MDSTSVSLLRRLHEPKETHAWRQFVELYAPLIYHWAKSRGLEEQDRKDLVQDVLTVLSEKLRDFKYDPNLRFRGWLRTVTVNKANDLLRRRKREVPTQGDSGLETVATTPESDLFEEENYRQFLVQRARKFVESEFEARTWQACWLHVTENRSAEDVGQELGMSANAVRVAKSRVLCRLREELSGLLD